MKKINYKIFSLVLVLALIAQCFIIADMQKKRFTKDQVLYFIKSAHASGYYNCLKGDTIYDENHWHQDSLYFIDEISKLK